MPDSGSALFTDIEEYRATLPMRSELLVLQPSKFRAHLTTVRLPHMRLLRASEPASRIAYFCLPQADAVVSFSTSLALRLVYRGLELGRGEMVFHRRGECFHQRTTDASSWGTISTCPTFLSSTSRVLLGRSISPPNVSTIVTPRRSDYVLLLRLHAQAGRIVEKNLSRIAHPEVARALDQDLLFALVTCLSSGRVRRIPDARGAEAMDRFEAAIAGHPRQIPAQTELAKAARVSTRFLNVVGTAVLGMGPSAYERRKWLRTVDVALVRAMASGVGTAEVERQYGLSGLEQFRSEYRSVYGEPPPSSLRHATECCSQSASAKPSHVAVETPGSSSTARHTS